MEPDWTTQEWDKWAGQSRSSSWAPQSWGAATPQRSNDKTREQKVEFDWHAESVILLNKYTTPATPKTQNYQAMETRVAFWSKYWKGQDRVPGWPSWLEELRVEAKA